MPLILPVLRAFWVFSNVFESFKALKMPLPSTRNGGHPTVRAMSQRKRNMKGCMTVWLVWCCFSTYERTLDGVVGLFIPFYSEIKSLVILFFLLTRARGAEPIYLHVLRPVVKPYVATLDLLLEITHTLGDFLLLLASIPLNFVASFYRPSISSPTGTPGSDHDQKLYPTAAPANSAERNAQRKGNGVPNGVPPTNHPTATSFGAVRARRRPLESAHARTNSGHPQPPNSRSSSRKRQDTGSHGEVQADREHDVWIPPQAAYDDETSSELPPTPPSFAEDQDAARNSTDDWRQYEPFPSAYPATPLVPTARLPSDRLARDGMSAISEEPRIDEPRDWRKYEAFPSAYPATPLNRVVGLPQIGHPPLHKPLGDVLEESSDAKMSSYRVEHDELDFQGSLERPRESSNPDSADSSDDREDTFGVHWAYSTAAEENLNIDEDGSDDEGEEGDEDDFDVTLRTPARLRLSRLENISKASSVLTDVSTGLSTVDNGSPLRSRTNSEVSTLLHSSDSSSVAGQKRPLPFSEEDGRTRTTPIRKLAQMPKRSAALGVAPTKSKVQTRASVARRPSKNAGFAVALDGTDSEVSDAAVSGVARRRRVGPSTSSGGSRQMRPDISRRSAGNRTIKASEVPVPANAVSRTAFTNETTRVRTKKPSMSTSQSSIRLAKTQDTDQKQMASETPVGEVPGTRKSYTVAPDGRSRSSTRR